MIAIVKPVKSNISTISQQPFTPFTVTIN